MSDEKLVTVHGNKQTLNLPNVFYTQIISSSYFKNILFKFVTYPEVVNFAKKEVKSLEPNFRNDNPTTLFYFVYKFHTLKLTINQLKALFKHKGCSLIRAIGFIYARFAINPNEIWDWLYDYIDDGEKVLETANPENYITIGQLVRRLLTENKYMDKHQLPRIPIPIQREKLKLLDKVDKYDDDDEESDDKHRNRRDRRDRSRSRDRRDRSRSRSRERNRRRDSRSRSRDRRDRSRSRDRNRRGSRDRSRDRSRERRNRSRSRSRERNTRRDSRSRSRDRRDRSRSRERNRRDSRDRSRDRSRERRNRSRSRSRDRRDRSRERDSVRDKRSRSTSSDRDQYHSKRNKNSSERSTDEPVSRSNASPPKKKLSMQQIEEMKRRYAGGTASINTTPQTKSDTKQEFVHLGYNN